MTHPHIHTTTRRAPQTNNHYTQLINTPDVQPLVVVVLMTPPHCAAAVTHPHHPHHQQQGQWGEGSNLHHVAVVGVHDVVVVWIVVSVCAQVLHDACL